MKCSDDSKSAKMNLKVVTFMELIVKYSIRINAECNKLFVTLCLVEMEAKIESKRKSRNNITLYLEYIMKKHAANKTRANI